MTLSDNSSHTRSQIRLPFIGKVCLCFPRCGEAQVTTITDLLRYPHYAATFSDVSLDHATIQRRIVFVGAHRGREYGTVLTAE